MRPSEALALNRDKVVEIIARYPVTNPRIFGSVARGEDVEGSDIDILVHPADEMSYFDLARLALDLEAVLGCKVDLGEDTALRAHAAKRILADARHL
jgi:predicted nucleotidyltransferase